MSTAPAPATATSSSPILGVHHVGIAAHDIAALAGFYRSSSGLVDWPAVDALQLPGGGLALAGLNAGLRLLPGADAPLRRPVSEAGLTHVCLQSTAIQQLQQAHARAGASFHSPLVDLGTGFLYSYARDPEHNVIELEGVAPVWADPQPWLAHVNLACADITRQAAFYAAWLGSTAARSPRLKDDTRLDQIADLRGVELRMAWIAARNMQVELIQYTEPAAQATGSHSTRRLSGASGHAYVAFEVSDLEVARALLLAQGGSVKDTLKSRQSKLGLCCCDPEGNALWLLDHDTLARSGAAIEQLPQPDVVPRFQAAYAALQGHA